MKGVKVLFAHDSEVALAAAAALINTVHGEVDALGTTAELAAFLDTWGWTGARAGTEQELLAVRALRPRLETLWLADEDTAVGIVNALLVEAAALPQLVRHDGWDYHLHATPSHAPLAARMAVEAAMAFSDVIRTRQLHRLRVCAARDCRDVMVDLSKNASRRFCDLTCANRTNVAAYRARQAAG